jgi:hypothetical protein
MQNLGLPLPAKVPMLNIKDHQDLSFNLKQIDCNNAIYKMNFTIVEITNCDPCNTTFIKSTIDITFIVHYNLSLPHLWKFIMFFNLLNEVLI